ncbi:endonuclease [Aliikangiella sp. G2MR2-5]|uniref:endonuclease n=1 Tax=Aliikangiella sp. G2MR2-5 TaxID=2788943 RepID=UPI0018AA3103|nr:endonuclease [Aliikangiella sp. G2MR2-5]
MNRYLLILASIVIISFSKSPKASTPSKSHQLSSTSHQLSSTSHQLLSTSLNAKVNSRDVITFRKAKSILKDLYKESPETFYCGCEINWDGKKLVPDWNSCGFTPRKQERRASRIEWEHVVPAWEFGHQLQCWQNGGRKNCSKVNAKFREMEGDLFNLVPAVGEVNGDRSNYRFGMIEGEPRVYGRCDAEVDFKARVFEPKEDIRGDIARTYFYFEEKYGLKISRKQKQLFAAWERSDPVSKKECLVAELKSAAQGKINEFLEKKCKAFAKKL